MKKLVLSLAFLMNVGIVSNALKASQTPESASPKTIFKVKVVNSPMPLDLKLKSEDGQEISRTFIANNRTERFKFEGKNVCLTSFSLPVGRIGTSKGLVEKDFSMAKICGSKKLLLKVPSYGSNDESPVLQVRAPKSAQKPNLNQ